jgi:hypothetical protein
MFYAPWDTKSQSAAGAFSRAAEAADPSLGAWGVVDCTVARQVCKGQQIKGFPIIKLFDGDKDAHLFSGPRLQVTDLVFVFLFYLLNLTNHCSSLFVVSYHLPSDSHFTKHAHLSLLSSYSTALRNASLTAPNNPG